MGRLCTREEYLRIKKNAHELPWGTLAFLLGEFKSLRKGLINPSLLVRAIKEKDRGERKFKAFRIKNCLSLSKIFTLSVIISSISNFKIF
jgi:hypothetical protein